MGFVNRSKLRVGAAAGICGCVSALIDSENHSVNADLTSVVLFLSAAMYIRLPEYFRAYAETCRESRDKPMQQNETSTQYSKRYAYWDKELESITSTDNSIHMLNGIGCAVIGFGLGYSGVKLVKKLLTT